MSRFLISLVLASVSIFATHVAADSMADDKNAILKMSGCFMVDYSFYETESLMQGYKLDSRVYDVDATKMVKELIIPVQVSDTHIRLQHILFFTDNAGAVGGMIKHQAEDWIYQPSWTYEFIEPNHWEPMEHADSAGKWVRRVTALDDGLRYQCLAAWDHSNANPEWSCATFAPIPGRETRDMGRSDYNTLDRKSRVVIYPGNWLERQDNIKTIFKGGMKTPLAREFGKTWYIRLAEDQCADAVALFEDRKEFWSILQDTWEQIFAKKYSWKELSKIGNVPRFSAMYDVEENYWARLKSEPTAAADAAIDIGKVIEMYRVK